MSIDRIQADREMTNVALAFNVQRFGEGVTGLTVEMKLFNGNNMSQFLDFADGTFKDAGHGTPTLALTEESAADDPGQYVVDGGFSLAAITIPTTTQTIKARYDITAGSAVGFGSDWIELFDRPVDLIWDEINRGADHNIKDSTGKQQRQASGGGGEGSEDVVSATASTVELAGSESAIDNFLRFREIVIVDGVGIGQSRVIRSYVGATKIATLDRPWDTTPIAGDDYLLLLGKRTFPDPQEVRDALKLDATAGAPAGGSVDEHLDDILADTNEIQGKLPTNFIMGSGVVTDKDDEIDAILLDTGTTLPARLTGIEGATFATGTDSLEAIRNQGDAAWLTATGFATPANVTAVITQGDLAWTTATGFAVAGDAMTLTAAGVDLIWDELQAGHAVAGSFGLFLDAAISGIAGSIDWSAGEREQIRSALGVDGTKTAATGGQLQDMQGATFATGTDSLEAIRNQGDAAWLTATGFATPANVTAVITQGNLAWTTATGFAVAGDPMTLTAAAVDLVWDELQAGHAIAGSFGIYLDAPISGIAGITPQAVRDAMKLAPTAGVPAVGSVDTHLDDILSLIGALNDIDIADVQTALTNQNYTAARGLLLSNLDALVSSRATQAQILSDATPFDGADISAILLDTAAIDGRLPSDPADESLQQAAHTQTQADIAGLNDLAIADVQTAMTNQGYTAARGPLLDELGPTNLPADVDALTQATISSTGTVAAGSSSTVVNTTISLPNDRPNSMQVLFTDGTVFVARNVNDYTNASGAFTVDDLGFTPGTGTTAILLARTGSVPLDLTPITDALDDIQGAGFDTATDSLEAIRNRGDAAWITATGFATPANVTAVITQGDAAWLTATGFSTPAQVTAVITQGDLAWTTAVGFATPAQVTAVTAAVLADLTLIKGAGFATGTHSLVNITADVGGIPAGVWVTDITGFEGDRDSAGGALNFMRQMKTNRFAYVGGAPGSETLRNDANTADLGSWSLTDQFGGLVLDAVSSPAIRGPFTP